MDEENNWMNREDHDRRVMITVATLLGVLAREACGMDFFYDQT